VLNTVINEAVI